LTIRPADRVEGALSRDRAGMSAGRSAASSAHAGPRPSLIGWSWPVGLAAVAPAGALAPEPVRCPGAGVTGAGRALRAGVFGVVIMPAPSAAPGRLTACAA